MGYEQIELELVDENVQAKYRYEWFDFKETGKTSALSNMMAVIEMNMQWNTVSIFKRGLKKYPVEDVKMNEPTIEDSVEKSHFTSGQFMLY